MDVNTVFLIGAFLGALIGILYGLKRIITLDNNIVDMNRKMDFVLKKIEEEEEKIEKDVSDEKKLIEKEESVLEDIEHLDNRDTAKRKFDDKVIKSKIDAVEKDLEKDE